MKIQPISRIETYFKRPRRDRVVSLYKKTPRTTREISKDTQRGLKLDLLV